MLALGFAAVPLYRMFCQVTGFQGTTQRATIAEAETAAAIARSAGGRTLSIRFDANTAPDLPWRFKPLQVTDTITIGQRDMAIFTARNLSDKPVTGNASFNVEPEQAGRYFNKIQCFCFTEQTLQPGQEVRMPVIYYVDPAALKDPEHGRGRTDHTQLHIPQGRRTADITFLTLWTRGAEAIKGCGNIHQEAIIMAGAKNHDYHILPPDIWPLIGSISALTFTSGMVLFMHDMANHSLVLGLGIAGLIATFFSWFSNIVKEAQAGDHTPVVQLHLRYGMILFIASEVMFFVGWFWSWFDFALFPTTLAEVVGGQYPPKVDRRR